MNQTENKLTISAGIKVSDLKAGYSTKVTFQNMEMVTASANVTIAHIEVYFETEMCMDENCTLKLNTFKIKDIGDIDVDINGLGPLGIFDWLLSNLIGFIADLVKGFVVYIFEGTIKDLLQKILEEFLPHF